MGSCYASIVAVMRVYCGETLGYKYRVLMRHMSNKTINHNKEIQEEKADGDGIVFVF